IGDMSPTSIRFFIVPLAHLFVTSLFFCFTDTATTEIYTLSLHDALPISVDDVLQHRPGVEVLEVQDLLVTVGIGHLEEAVTRRRSEEHTSELQSPCNLVCRLLLEKKNKK